MSDSYSTPDQNIYRGFSCQFPMLTNPVSLPARNSDQSYPAYILTGVQGAHYAAVAKPVKMPHPGKDDTDLRPTYMLGIPNSKLPEPDFSDMPLWLTHIRPRRDGVVCVASHLRPILHVRDGDYEVFSDALESLHRYGIYEPTFINRLTLDVIVQPFYMERKRQGRFERVALALLGVSVSAPEVQRVHKDMLKTAQENFHLDRTDGFFDIPKIVARKHVSERISLSAALKKSVDENSHEDMLEWVYAFMSGPVGGGAAVCNDVAQARRVSTLIEYCKSVGFSTFRDTLKAGHGRGLYAAMAWYTGDEPKPKKARTDGWIEGEDI